MNRSSQDKNFEVVHKFEAPSDVLPSISNELILILTLPDDPGTNIDWDHWPKRAGEPFPMKLKSENVDIRPKTKRHE